MSDPGLSWLQILARHFVSLFWVDEPADAQGRILRGDGRHFEVSGFVLSVRDHWLLVTAGHVLRDIDLAQGQGRLMTACFLADGWGHGATHPDPIPFDYSGAAKKVVGNADDIDYGIIRIGPLYRALLEANQITPLVKEDWSEVPDNLPEYYLLGLPAELVPTERLLHRRNPITVPTGIKLVVLHVDPTHSPPQCLLKTALRFYGRIETTAQEGGRNVSFNDISGMSGGPLFGAREEDKGIRYWLVGVQSGWASHARVIAACPIAGLVPELDAFLAEP